MAVSQAVSVIPGAATSSPPQVPTSALLLSTTSSPTPITSNFEEQQQQTPRTISQPTTSSHALGATETEATTTPPSPSLSTSPSLSQFTYSSITNSTPNSNPSSVDQSTRSSFSSSPRRYPTDLTTPIPEECDETESESPNEPVTPISGRQSRDFGAIDQTKAHQNATSAGQPQSYPNYLAPSIEAPEHPETTVPYQLSQRLNSKPPLTPQDPSKAAKSLTPTTATSAVTADTVTSPDKSANPRRPSTRGSNHTSPLVRRRSSGLSFKNMTSFFRRTSSNFRNPNYNHGSSSSNPNIANQNISPTPAKMTPNGSQQRFAWRRSVATTRSNSPPSPGSPLEMAPVNKEGAARPTLPSSRDFFDNNKKTRVSTGFSLRGRVNFAGHGNKNETRRVRSVERKKHGEGDLISQPFVIVPDTGTGMKARRLSLSLPDDFTVDIAELMKEFEYQHKLLGRHGKHLGKGATSKVTLMVRKGSPTELYAVKEFRAKKSDESTSDYEQKIKSEYSIAKSLHHPNIVETIRLCTDHGRWNHVMEYCAEGDLFNLVSKKYLQEEGREADRLCLFKQLIQGVNYLHTNGIAHRDIKLENLLITKDSKLKITDFGVSEVFSGIHPGLREAGGQCGQKMSSDIRLCKPGICGSEPYIAPEVLSKQGEYDPRALDVWSSAVVMIYLIFSANLWEKASTAPGTRGNDNYVKLVRAWDKYNTKKANNPDLSKDVLPYLEAFHYCVKPVPLRRLLLNMLNPNPNDRISISEVINNRWLKNVECCQMESYDDPVKVIDVSKKDWMKSGAGKIYCHNHLPLQSTSHGLPPMPGKAGY
ncbi:kinase-like domain-containing protein [Xylariales sp. PMI_506]|nr:kinase-like domain-containing protein [Xylariales sp. PMI_506]